MGIPTYLARKIQSDSHFKNFMDSLEKEAIQKEQQIQVQLNNYVERHYKSNEWQYEYVFREKQHDYQNYDDWGLTNLYTFIDTIGNICTSDYKLTLVRVKAIVSAIFTKLAIVTDHPKSLFINDLSLSGGLHLFFGTSGALYTQNHFFSNSFIGTTQLVFQVYRSMDEYNAIGLQQLLSQTSKELHRLKTMIPEIQKEQEKSVEKILWEKPEDYISTKLVYDVGLENIKQNFDDLEKEYSHYNHLIETLNPSFDQTNLWAFDAKRATKEAANGLFKNQPDLNIAIRYIQEKTNLVY